MPPPRVRAVRQDRAFPAALVANLDQTSLEISLENYSAWRGRRDCPFSPICAELQDRAVQGGAMGSQCPSMAQHGRTYFHYHRSAADTLDKVVPSELRENAAAMAVLAYAPPT
jgi:hypothetical protein